MVAVEEVPESSVSQYGVVRPGSDAEVFPILDLVEKPAPGTAPSNLYIMGRYILQPEIFRLLGNHRDRLNGR